MRDVAINVSPASMLPNVRSRRGPCLLSTRRPSRGMTGRDARRNSVIVENSARETPSSSLIGITKKESPYPLIPAVIMLALNAIPTMLQP